MADIKIAGRIKAGSADGISGYASEILFDDAASNKTVKEKIEEVASSPQTMIVTISPDGNEGYEADKTFAEIKAFIDNGGTLIAKDEEDGDSYYYLDNYIASEVVFTRNIWGSGGFSTRYYTIDNTNTVSFIDSVHHISSAVDSSSTTNLANSAAVKTLRDSMSEIKSISVNNTEQQVDQEGNVDIAVPTSLADLAGDSTHRTVTDAEKTTWNGKQNALTFDDTPTANSNNPVKSGGVYQAIQDIDVSSQISGKADKSEMSVVAGTGANADKTTITLKSGTSATVLTQHQDVSGKEDKSNKVTSFSSPTDTQYPSAKLVSDQLATKQGTISDLSTIRSNAAAGATAYQKPGTGIPKTDLASAVQTSLGKADTAIQSVTVGTTTTGAAGTNASVTNTGTATEPVLSFTIPQGAQGIQGIQGPQGERGPQGNTGVQVDSVASIIHSIDPTATYAAADVAGADAVQDVLAEVTELEGELNGGKAVAYYTSAYLTGFNYIENPLINGKEYKLTVHQTQATWMRFGFAKDNSGTDAYYLHQKNVIGDYEYTFNAPDPSVYPYMVLQKPNTNSTYEVSYTADGLIDEFTALQGSVSSLGTQIENLDEKAYVLDNELKYTVSCWNLLYPQTSGSDYALTTTGICVSNSSAELVKYEVTAGQKVYLRLSKDNDAVFQFQNSNTVPSTGTNPYIIGTVVTEAVDGIFVVPTGAIRLIVSRNKTNSTNIVRKYGGDQIQKNKTDIVALHNDVVGSVNQMTTAATATWEQTAANSGYKPFAITSGKTYILQLQCQGIGDLNYARISSIKFYSSQSGSSIVGDNILSTFKDAGDIFDEVVSIEYTPQDNINYIVIQFNGAYSAVNGNSITVTAIEKSEKYASKNSVDDIDEILEGVDEQAYYTTEYLSGYNYIPNELVSGLEYNLFVHQTQDTWCIFGFSKDNTGTDRYSIHQKKVTGDFSYTFNAPDPTVYPYMVVMKPSPTTTFDVRHITNPGLVGAVDDLKDKFEPDYVNVITDKEVHLKEDQNLTEYIPCPMFRGVTYKVSLLLDGHTRTPSAVVAHVNASNSEVGRIVFSSSDFASGDYVEFTPTEDVGYLLINFISTYTEPEGAYMILNVKYVEKSVISYYDTKPFVGKKFIMLGDSITQLPRTGGLHGGVGIVEWFSYLSGAEVIRGAIGGRRLTRTGTKVTTANEITGYNTAVSFFDVIGIAEALASGDFSLQRAAYQWLVDNNYSPDVQMIEEVDVLDALDMSTVDAITIFAGTNDWHNSVTLQNIKDAIDSIVETLLTAYPKLTIYFFTPIVRFQGNNLSNWSDTWQNNAGLTIPQYVDAIMEQAKANCIPVCDLYHGMGWTRYNVTQYIPVNDGTHPRNGFGELAAKMFGFVNSNWPKVYRTIQAD